MGRLANLTTLADRSAARPLLTSAEIQARHGTRLSPCYRCDSHHLALSHRGDWFCPECSAWLAAPADCPDELPLIAALFWSVAGLAVSGAEVDRTMQYIDAVILPDGEVLYPLGRMPPKYWRWWEGREVGYDPFEEAEILPDKEETS